MNLPELAIKNSHFIFVIVGILLFVGVKSYNSIPKSEDPSMDLPIYTVIVLYPGAGPEDMEEYVVDPIEDIINDLDDITEIRTEITNELAVLKVQAQYGIDYDDKYDEIITGINNIRAMLPQGIYDLKVTQYKPEDRVVVQQYAILSDDARYDELYDVAEKFQDQIEQINFVKQTHIGAYPKEEIKIKIDFAKLSALSISLDQVIIAIRRNNMNIPGGDIDAGTLNFNIKSTGSYSSLKEIDNIVINTNNSHTIYLSDIAIVEKGYESQKWLARFNGKRCIYLTVHQKSNSNILNLSKELETVTTKFRNQLPEHIQIETAFEQASAVKHRINDFIANLLLGIVLVGLIIWVFLGWRSGLIVMTVIPLSILMAITLLDYTGYAMQQISIAALVIALGLLVDNGIVVIENIIRLHREGNSLIEAAAKGTSEVSYAIISSTITTILAFAPLAMLGSGPGEYLRSLPLTVIFALTASLILAIGFTPIIAKNILNSKAKKSQQTWMHGKMKLLIIKVYRPALKYSLNKGWLISITGLLFLLGSLSLFPKIGVSFFPTADKSLLLISVDLPYSSGLNRTDQAIRYVENVLDTTSYVKSYAVNIGHGNPQVYYNRVPEEFKKYHGEVLVNFKDWDPDLFYTTLDQFKKAFSQSPDARISFSELKNGSPFEAPIEIILQGDDLNYLKKLARDVENILKQTDGTYNVHNPMALAKTDIKVDIHKYKVALYNLSQLDIGRTLKAGMSGLIVDKITLDNEDETYPLSIELHRNSDPGFDDLNRIYFTNQKGLQVPLKQVSDINFEANYAKISHFNLTRSIGITANVTDPDNTKMVTESVINELNKYDWPEGYSYYIGGEYESQQQSFGDLGTLLMLALLGIFAVLVLQFRSIIQPLIIFTAIPLAITGSFIALFLTGWSFSFFAFVGFISLVGIVVNNSIILVDYTNQLMNTGIDKLAAIQKAAERRFMPIVLTTLTTILGLIPLTLSGTNLWSPLGWTLIGGLISSMVLTLLIVPVLYNWFTPKVKVI